MDKIGRLHGHRIYGWETLTYGKALRKESGRLCHEREKGVNIVISDSVLYPFVISRGPDTIDTEEQIHRPSVSEQAVNTKGAPQ